MIENKLKCEKQVFVIDMHIQTLKLKLVEC